MSDTTLQQQLIDRLVLERGPLVENVELLLNIKERYCEQIDIMGCQACAHGMCPTCRAVDDHDKWVKKKAT